MHAASEGEGVALRWAEFPTAADAVHCEAPVQVVAGRSKFSIACSACSELAGSSSPSRRSCECTRTFGWGEHDLLMAFMQASGFEPRLVRGMENSRHVRLGTVPSGYEDCADSTLDGRTKPAGVQQPTELSAATTRWCAAGTGSLTLNATEPVGLSCIRHAHDGPTVIG